jgi:hypothetical protein
MIYRRVFETHQPFEDLLQTYRGLGLLYIILVPTVVGSILGTLFYKKKLEDPKMLDYFGLLYTPYKKEYFWYEMVIITRRFVFALVTGLADPKSPSMSFGILIVLLTAIVSSMYLR